MESVPLWVLAPARSCSSLVVAMLGQHPQLYGFPELRLFRAADVAGLLATPARLGGLLRALAQLHEERQNEEAVENAYQWLESRAHWSVTSVLDHLLDLVSPLTGVEKSPETSRTDDALHRAATAYPGARILHLVRHPWSTVQSMLHAWSSLSHWNVDPEDAPGYCLNVWTEQHLRIAEFGESLEFGQLLRVRAEDVVNEPLDALPEFCRWMGIDDAGESIRVMLHPERSPYASPGPMNALGGFDPKFLSNPRLRRLQQPSPVMPDAWLIDDRSFQAAADLARRFGYDIEPRRLHPIRVGLPRRAHQP